MGRHTKRPWLLSNIALAILGLGVTISLVAGVSLILIDAETGSVTPAHRYTSSVPSRTAEP